jgi:hypothetical protein
MRKMIIGAVTAAALLCAPVTAGAATAVPLGSTPADSPWSPNPSSNILPNPNPLAAGQFCAFAVQVAIVTNKEVENTTTLPDGSTVIKVKGNLVLSFQNLSTGKTIERNVSGPTTTTISPDGSSGTETGGGNNWFTFGPDGQANTGEAGLIFTSGRFTATFTTADNTAHKFTLDGHQENGCTLLS